MNKAIAILLSAALISLVAALPANASPRSENDEQSAARIKTEIAKLGTGPGAYVEVKLRDGTRLKGYIDSSKTMRSPLWT
jgi:hypothetical protein